MIIKPGDLEDNAKVCPHCAEASAQGQMCPSCRMLVPLTELIDLELLSPTELSDYPGIDVGTSLADLLDDGSVSELFVYQVLHAVSSDPTASSTGHSGARHAS